MPTILITSPTPTAGKTSLAYALLSRLRDAGRTAAYYKPYSATPDGEHLVPRRFRLAKETTMRDSFVGDIGDFGKFGLLRYLCGVTGPRMDNPLRLAVIWYRNESGSADGNRIDYLNVSDSNDFQYRNCDLVLYDTLQRLVGASLVCRSKRNIGQISNNRILPDDTQYYDVPLPVGERRDWLEAAIKKTDQASLLFVDPDNGIAKEEDTNSREHVSLGELKRLYEKGKSLIIYQHLDRTDPKTQAKEISKALEDKLGLSSPPWALWWRRIAGRIFFIVVHPDHADDLNQRVQAFVNKPEWFKQQPRFDHAHFKNITLPKKGTTKCPYC